VDHLLEMSLLGLAFHYFTQSLQVSVDEVGLILSTLFIIFKNNGHLRFIDLPRHFPSQLLKPLGLILRQVLPHIIVHKLILRATAKLGKFGRAQAGKIGPALEFEHLLARIVLLRERFGEGETLLGERSLLYRMQSCVFEFSGQLFYQGAQI
jgi:hypothetical protein